MKAVNGQPPRKPHDAGQPLCSETQGRQIVAALVNEAVEEALGLALAGSPARQGGKSAKSEPPKPSK